MANETQKLFIEVKVNADTGKLDIVNGALVKMDKAAAGAGGSGGGLNKLGSALGVNLGAFAGTTGAAIVFAKVLKDSVENEEKEVQRQRTLKITIDALGIGYTKNKTAINDNLKSLTNHTKFMKEEATDVYNKAVKSQGSLEGGYKLMKIAMDAASISGKPLDEEMELLTGSLAGGARGTKVLKEEFGKLVGNGKTAAEMIENVGKSINGTAKNEDDMATQTKGLKQEYTDITTVIGKGLMPVINGLATTIKGVMVPVIVVLAYSVSILKNVFTAVTGKIEELIAFMISGPRGAAAVQKNVAAEIAKDWGDSTKFVGDSINTMFGTMKDSSAKAGNAILKNVQEPVEKIKNTTKTAKDTMEKSFEEVAKSIQATLGSELDKVFKNMADSGGVTKKTLDEAFTGIYQSFRDMLIKMVAELVAREAIIGLLSLLSGGGVGFATSMLQSLTAKPASGAQGAFAVGTSNVPRSGLYHLDQGETVGKSSSGGGGNTIVINAGVSAFDTRAVSNNDLARLARQLTPHINRELQRLK